MAEARLALRQRRAAAKAGSPGRGRGGRSGGRGPGRSQSSPAVDLAAEQREFMASLLPRSDEEVGSANHLLWMQLQGHFDD